MPALGAGISASTLSVEISKIGSSRLMESPTFFIQRESVPSAIDSPIWGMITSILAIDVLPERYELCAMGCASCLNRYERSLGRLTISL
jgi:hypothetical protein